MPKRKRENFNCRIEKASMARREKGSAKGRERAMAREKEKGLTKGRENVMARERDGPLVKGRPMTSYNRKKRERTR